MAFVPEESQLLVAVAAGDRHAFTQLHSAYLGGIKRYLFLFTSSEDLAQELSQQVFIRLWEHRAQLAEVVSLRGYLYQAAKNLAFDEVRRQQRQVSAYAHAQAEVNPYLPAADEALISAQDYAQAQALIRRLPAQRRTIFLLRTEQELSLDEIAERMALSKSGVKKQLYSAIAFIKKNLLPADHVVARLGALWLLLQATA